MPPDDDLGALGVLTVEVHLGQVAGGGITAGVDDDDDLIFAGPVDRLVQAEHRRAEGGPRRAGPPPAGSIGWVFDGRIGVVCGLQPRDPLLVGPRLGIGRRPAGFAALRCVRLARLRSVHRPTVPAPPRLRRTGVLGRGPRPGAGTGHVMALTPHRLGA